MDATKPYAVFNVGPPFGNDRGVLGQYEYTVTKRLDSYSEHRMNELVYGINEFDYMEYEVLDECAKEVFELADRVSYQGISLYISQITCEIKDNCLYNTYKLATEYGLKMPIIKNEEIQGISVPGRVIGVQKNLLKLHLEIDRKQPVETARWFDYAAFYATWYCMPEIGDIVNLHFPTASEQDAIGLNSLKQNPEGGYTRNNVNTAQEGGSEEPGMESTGDQRTEKHEGVNFAQSASDPNVKMLTTKSGRMVLLGPDSVTIQYDGGTFVTLSDSGGIVLRTSKDVSICAVGHINAVAEKDIVLMADEKITIRNQQSSIELEPGSIIIKSADTKMN